MDPLLDTPAIRVRDLVVAFGDHIVLDHLSLDICKGEILGLVGGSGSGKSVLLRTIIGLLPKQQGSIEVLGVDLDKADDAALHALERRWGVLFQQGALFSSLTALQNVQFPMRENLDLSERLLRDAALTKLGMVGLDARDAEKLPSELSGGMIKRDVVLATGHSVIVDAVFGEPDARQDIAALAKNVGIPFHGIWLEADPEKLLRRVAARRNDASDATPEIVRGQLQSIPGAFSNEWTAVDAGGTMDETVAGARAAIGVGNTDFGGPRI